METLRPRASQSTTIARTSHCKLLTCEWFADVSPWRPSIASSRTVLRTGSASLRAEAFPRRLCRACCSRMCASLTHDVFQLGLRKPTRQHLPRGDRSVPLAAKEARLPHVSVAGGNVLRMRDEACVVRACCDNGSLLFIVQELRFDPCMQLAAFASIFLSKPHVLLQVARMLHACLRCKVRASAGASWWWTLSSNVKTVTELCVREALHPWWLWETQSLLCLE